MSRIFKGISAATALTAVLWACPAAFADGDGQEPRLELKDSARYADLTRSGDRVGDQHELLLLECATKRYPDVLGDFEEKRILRAFAKGRRATLHAVVARDHDHASDRRQIVLAKLTTARLSADTRRLRDLGNDKRVYTAWRRGQLRYGPHLGGGVDIAKTKQDPDGVRRHEDKLLNRVDQQDDTRLDRRLERDEREIERGEERARRALERKLQRDQRDEERDEDRDEADEERDEADEERDEERDEEAGEADEERDAERGEERDEERDLDAEEEKTIQNEEE
jgi:hypothetical protein